MVSFDVTSIFTSIPQHLAVETIELLLREKYDETENRLGHAQIIQLLKFRLKTHFTFDGTIYEQVKGMPMGSPISGLIAEAVLQRLESLVFRHHRPKFWARYVDDTFVVIERDQVLTFKEQLNAVFPDIQFTMEEEENNQLAFLDVLACRKVCGGLKTKMFRFNAENLKKYWDLAELLKSEQLVNACLQHIKTTLEATVASDLFIQLPADAVLSILRADDLIVDSEESVVRSIELWDESATIFLGNVFRPLETRRNVEAPGATSTSRGPVPTISPPPENSLATAAPYQC
nr:unnamed protein product [Spirometra erinaceieuropaei]